jgi:hypothetical protein
MLKTAQTKLILHNKHSLCRNWQLKSQIYNEMHRMEASTGTIIGVNCKKHVMYNTDRVTDVKWSEVKSCTDCVTDVKLSEVKSCTDRVTDVKWSEAKSCTDCVTNVKWSELLHIVWLM